MLHWPQMNWKSFAAAVATLALLPLLSLAQENSRPVILAFGDSMTAGYGVPQDLGYPEQLQKKLDAAGYKYRVVNMGITGDTTRGGRARMTRALTTIPAIVILELGGNDRSNGLSPKQTQENLEQMIALFQRAHATIILAGRRLPGQENVYAILAEKYHLSWISNFLEGVSGNPELTISDGTHPNADGYAIVSTTVLKAIEPFLKK